MALASASRLGSSLILSSAVIRPTPKIRAAQPPRSMPVVRIMKVLLYVGNQCYSMYLIPRQVFVGASAKKTLQSSPSDRSVSHPTPLETTHASPPSRRQACHWNLAHHNRASLRSRFSLCSNHGRGRPE